MGGTGAVSKIEPRGELYVGTLREFIAAVEGELVLVVPSDDAVEVQIRLTEARDAA